MLLRVMLMQKIAELDPADAVRAITPLYTSLDFI
jgi:hypothetical protein